MIQTTAPTLSEISSAASEILRKGDELPQHVADQPDDFGEMIDAIRSASTALNQRLAQIAFL